VKRVSTIRGEKKKGKKGLTSISAAIVNLNKIKRKGGGGLALRKKRKFFRLEGLGVKQEFSPHGKQGKWGVIWRGDSWLP